MIRKWPLANRHFQRRYRRQMSSLAAAEGNRARAAQGRAQIRKRRWSGFQGKKKRLEVCPAKLPHIEPLRRTTAYLERKGCYRPPTGGVCQQKQRCRFGGSTFPQRDSRRNTLALL